MNEIEQLVDLIKDACQNCSANTIAMSGGLDSTIIAYLLKDQKPKTISIISEDFLASDLTYCQMAVKEFGLNLIINKVSTTEILNGVEETIKILKNFNDIEIRNNVVMYLVLNWAKSQNISKIISGDGADELFAGYNFLQKKSEQELEKDLKRIRETMHFPSQKIGDVLKIVVETPFLDKKIIEFSKFIPTNLLVKQENNKSFGKWILRKAFEYKIPKQIAWREKSPMQDGAGTAGLTNLFETLISDEKFNEKKKKIENDDDVIIRTKESLYYYDIFRKYFEPQKNNSETACPFCKSSVEDSKFCRMCGAFPI